MNLLSWLLLFDNMDFITYNVNTQTHMYIVIYPNISYLLITLLLLNGFYNFYLPDGFTNLAVLLFIVDHLIISIIYVFYLF